jgi:amino acid transporter/nucleotide-binding universal stress UspA family protein
LFAATAVGVGAIVGGGVLALAGVAFAVSGPSAILAFALNGLIAALTAASFAEMASRFPESGGTYTFSRKVLSVEAAFSVGWVVWFASIVAAVLYALGFAHFALIFLRDLLAAGGVESLQGWQASGAVSVLAIGTTLGLAVSLTLNPAGGGPWANVAKVVVFAALIVAGLWAVSRQAPSQTVAALQPFFTGSASGLFQAMGYTFIAVQGFDLIAAVGGEVRNPAKTIPRAMFLSLAIALLIYLPLLLVIATVGTPPGRSIADAAADDPEGFVALAAESFLGPSGYFLVIIAAMLSMFTALQANLFAASRIALAMSRDRTLPPWLGRVSANRKSPVNAILVTATLVSVLIVTLPDVAAAGAASSLIFLITFAIAHGLSVLVRWRSTRNAAPFRAPLFPAIPIVGGTGCLALAVFQGLAVPSAGTITVVWLSIGGVLFLTLFARRARLMDVSRVAANPELVRLRGNTPLVLVPIANPHHAEAMISLADALVPAEVGRVLLHTIVVADTSWDPDNDPEPANRSQSVLRELLRASSRLGVRVETLTTVSPRPMEEIVRVARLHRCESALLGLSEIEADGAGTELEGLLSALDADVVLLRAPGGWQLSKAERILVPVGGRGGHDYLLARLLGSLSRSQQPREVAFVRAVPTQTSARQRAKISQELDQMARDYLGEACQRELLCSDDPAGDIARLADRCGLMILGVQRIGPRQKLFGKFTRRIAQEASCPILVISRRG